MDMTPDKRQETPDAETQPNQKTASTPTHIRVLAFIGAVAMIALSVAFAWAIATGGIFAF